MTRLVHLSDLHFGRDRAELAAPLRGCLEELAPELVIVSGDLTQRARKHQFAEARTFLDGLGLPWLAVPGNHDTPLDNLFLRFLRPFSRFRAAVSAQLEPVHLGDGYTVVGLNTVNPQAWQSGKLRRRSLRHVERALAERDGFGLVVMHHPPEMAPGDRKRGMRGAERGLRELAHMGADLVLCGHLHVWRAMPLRAEASILMLQAGTGLSNRLRGEPNDFNLLEIDDCDVLVSRYGAGSDEAQFQRLSRTRFRKEDARWEVLT
ncbi:metallophosphoesterase family protein [Litorisediminicola beolgyonensis]|uniref:Metallophosphoesterase family protein n=1 Tax=Litorisediminicola beolgyonensis TaxID=1173614 RepID=A0ABW3ZGV5_9RHOB